MAKKEDNRDIFDKALDYAVPAAGAYLGGKAGARAFSGGKKARAKLKAEQSRYESDKARAIAAKDPNAALDADHNIRGVYDDMDEHSKRRFYGGAAGGVIGGVEGAYINYLNNLTPEQRKRMDAASPFKRRK